MEDKRKPEGGGPSLALRIAEELCLRLLQRRTTSPAKVPGLIALIGAECLSCLEAEEEPGPPFLRMAAALTGRLIERVSLYEPAAVCRSLREHTLALRGLAKGLPREHSREILSCSVTLVLKMLETRTLSGADVPRALGSVVASARALFPGA